ncbi:hypothetical protein [Thiocapsa bogorovii]|uniref:hypothetical protein n=1 Tax=Thiocapsa bogorovii TaxID=521689 RepID=UPI001E633BE5|nr:hypothetical protein [Thiocapsa bogorovii]UHD15179.1 hypothetical protein LT988_18130 [Thiocapsa bogorovii]
MNNEYVKQTLAFIKKSDLPLLFPEFREVKLLPDGKWEQKIFSIARVRLNEIARNRLLVQMLIFTLVDSFIDLKYPTLDGLSFKKRYDGLSSGNDSEVIFRETYRLLKLMRNAAIHSRSGISTLNNELSIIYNFRSTQYELRCTSDAVMWLYSFVFLYISVGGDRSTYRDAIWRSYYDNISAGIRIISDEVQSPLGSVAAGLRLKVNVRPDYQRDSAGSRFEPPAVAHWCRDHHRESAPWPRTSSSFRRV